MATFHCVSMPQFIAPAPSTSADIQITSNDSDSGESSGASVGMRGLESSDDGGSTSSRQTPPEYPSPSPPSKSPPADSMPSLQAESPIGDDEDTQCDVVEGNAISNEGVDFSVLSKEEQMDKINEWIVQQGYHPVPYDKTVKHGPGMVFVHVLDGELKLNICKDKQERVSIVLEGPGTILMVGASGHVPQAAPFKLGPSQQCHQFLDPDGRLLHVVLSNCSPDRSSQELNVPKLCRKQELMDAMGMSPSPPGPSDGGRRSNGGNGGNSRGNGRYSNGNGYQRNANGQQAQSSSESADGSIRNERGYNGQSNADKGWQSQRYGNTFNERRYTKTNGAARRGNGHHGHSNSRGFSNNKINGSRGNRYGGNRGNSKQYHQANNQHYQKVENQQYQPMDNQQYHPIDNQQYHPMENQQYQQVEYQQYPQADNQQYQQGNMQQYPQNQQYYQPDGQQYYPMDNQQWKPQEETINNNNAQFGNLQQFQPQDSSNCADNESIASSEDSIENTIMSYSAYMEHLESLTAPVPNDVSTPAPSATFPSPNAPEFHPQGLLVPAQPQMEVQPHPVMIQQNGVPMQDMQMVPMMPNGMVMQPVYYQQPGPSMMLPQYLPAPPKGMLVVSAEMQFIDNQWVECDMELQKRVMFDVLSEMPRPFQVNSLTTSCMFELGFVYLKAFQYHRGVMQLPITKQKEMTIHVTVLDNDCNYLKDFDAKFLLEKTQEGKRLFNVTDLIPNECYHMGFYAKTTDNKFQGVHSRIFSFRTAPGLPDPPKRVHVTNRGLHFFTIKWDEGTNNGSLIFQYAIEIRRNGERNGIVTFKNHDRGLDVFKLMPQECYNIRITAFNALGESLYGTEFNAFTKPNRAPSAPQNVKIVSVSHRSISISWDENPNAFVTVECYNNATKTVEIIRKDLGGTSTVITDLLPATQYQFRLKASNEFGEQWTKYFTCHTQKELMKIDEDQNRKLSYYEKRQLARLRCPQPAPTFEKYVLGFPVMVWNSSGLPDEEYTYIVEGSRQTEPYRFIEMDRTNELSYVVTDPKITNLRIVRVGNNDERSYPSPRADVPWDRSYCKLEKVHDVECSSICEGGVLVKWKKVNVEKVPPTAVVFYNIQQPNLSVSDLICVGDVDEYVLENIPGSTKIEIQVRAVFLFHKKMAYGDWSFKVHHTTPRALPSKVHNIRFNSHQSKLEWDCIDISTDLQYLVEAKELSTNNGILKLTTKEKDVIMDCVQPGQKFVASIISETGAGKSNAVQAEISIPALCPGAPKNLFVSNIETNGCTVHWKASEPNGAPVFGHNVYLMINGKILATHFVPIVENKTNCSFQLENLRSCTDYTVVVNGKNEVGHGSRVEVSFITATKLPTVPKVWSSPESTHLKVWWDDTSDDQDLVYKLVRVNEKTKQESTVYQGDALQTKIKGLKESTRYIFKLQVKDTRTAAISWSEPFEFETTVAPPPPIKQQPTITIVPKKTHLYKAEWAHCLSEQTQFNQVYQLQVADATIEKAKWQTDYEGKAPRHNINTEQFPGALHVRVLVVRKDGEKEVTGSPSPVGYIANIPPEIEVVKDEVVVEEHVFKRILGYVMDMLPPKVVLITVFVMFIFMLSFSEYIFNFLTGGMAETKPPAHSPFPSPPASKPPQ